MARAKAPLIDIVKAELAIKGLTGKKNQSRTWLQNKFSTSFVRPHDIINDKKRRVSKPVIGKLFFYYYDAKWKDKLPFWDAFPLTIPIEYYPNGFLGLNLHYLAPKQRAFLLDRLQRIALSPSLTAGARLKLSYDLLKGARNFNMAKPAIKRYLYNHVKSPFIEIDTDEWDIAVFLPVENFQISKKRVFG